MRRQVDLVSAAGAGLPVVAALFLLREQRLHDREHCSAVHDGENVRVLRLHAVQRRQNACLRLREGFSARRNVPEPVTCEPCFIIRLALEFVVGFPLKDAEANLAQICPAFVQHLAVNQAQRLLCAEHSARQNAFAAVRGIQAACGGLPQR